MALSNSNQDYNNCVANCKSLFPNSDAALVACINGCAKVNSPADAGVFTDLAVLNEEFQKNGREHFCSDVRIAAKKALSGFPDERELTKIDQISRSFVQRTSLVIHEALKLSDADDSAMLKLINDSAWVKLTADLVGSVVARLNNGGGSGGSTCVTKCANEYNQCLTENSCSHSFVCICCIPCSLQYSGCVARCVVGVGGFGGVVIA